MVRREPKNHYDDCYLCIPNIKDINCKNMCNLTYLNLESARRPVPHLDKVPIPASKLHLNDSDILQEAEVNSSDSDLEDPLLMVPQRFDQLELNNQMRLTSGKNLLGYWHLG
ncbi:hypothetical protein LOD99_14608 [Oopsacas minuta]|uniref:Uncharacterized protein n=1 Tax=Oopsacas minuta TaxID=111878 RepID=A0AAV7KF07_9METZ|nr:hypothetical protein LOD99_14608 [Oopsacas minuta]